MKKILLIALSSIALAAPAYAADLAMKALPLPMAVPFNWTGFYVGGNVGYSWGNARTDIAGSATAIAVADPFFGGGFPTSVAFADANKARLSGAIGGGQIGYNYQFSPKWVLGFEADIQGSGVRGSNTFVDPFSGQWCHSAFAPPPVCTLTQTINGTAVTNYEAKIEWFGTVRGRLGVLVTDQVLLYGTGGLAYGQVSLSGNSNVNGSLLAASIFPTTPFTAPGSSTFSASKTNVGFTVGGGVEGKLSANWTWKLEYLYLDLGSLDTPGLFPATTLGAGINTPLTGPMAVHAHFTDNIVRVGLNYKFEIGGSQVVAKY